ncbi:MAG TPA: response regulator, partial [Stellaceae bacterium]|nr:response regulator [Stellaceae bacterium]
RGIIVRLLREEGFDVSATASGWTALVMVRRKPFDLLIADILLPDGLDGLEVAKCARLERPSLRCLFVSGRSQAVTDDPERDDFVCKPFRRHELLGCVWELLHRRVAPRPLGWEARQAERTLLAAEINCRRKKLLAGRRARRASR